MKLLYRGPFCSKSGYGVACHDNLMALKAAGIDFDIQLVVDADTDDLPARYAALLKHLPTEADVASRVYTHVIVHAIPILAYGMLDNLPPDTTKILVTTWETSILHGPVVGTMNKHFDFTIVPSRFNADSFIKSGVDPLKLIIIPHAYDHLCWDHEGMRVDKEDPHALDADRPYTFYNISTWTARKNSLAPILAYLAEFGPDEDVCFKHVTNDYKREDIFNLMYSGAVRKPPKLEILGTPKRLTDEEMRNLHRTSDCFVTLSRGEAFNLGAFEATLADNPVISIAWGGAMEFLQHYPGAKFVRHFLTPVLIPPPSKKDPEADRLLDEEMGVGKGVTYGQNWAEPDIDGARKLMREAFETHNRKSYREGYYDWVLNDRFSYEAVGRQFKRALEEM